MEENKKTTEEIVSEKELKENEKFEEELKERFDKAIAKSEKKMEKEKTADEKVADHFEEVIAKNEKKMKKAEKKAKKRLKVWQVILIAILAIILLAGIGVGGYLLVKTITYKPYKPILIDFENSRPAYASTYTAAEQAKIDAALQNNATEDQIKEAIAMIYAKANANKIAADKAISISRGQGSATVGIPAPFGNKVIEAEGSMAVRAFRSQSGEAFYYQKGAKVVDCTSKGLIDIVSNVLNQQEKTYASGTGVYKTLKAKGADAKVSKTETATIPYFAVGKPEEASTYVCADRDEFLEKGYYLDDPRELCNFRITKETIVLKELEEGEKYITYDADNKYYKLKFSLLIEGEGHDACVQVARQYLRDSSDSDNLEYGKFDLTFEVWDNGYAKFMHDDEVWAGDFELLGKMSRTASDNWYETVFYYDFDENLFTAEDYAKYQEGADWALNIINDYAASLN